MKKLLLLFLIIICQLLTSSFLGYAQQLQGAMPATSKDTALQTEVKQWVANSHNLRFIENKGQMATMDGKPDNDLLFEANGNGVSMFITTSGISYMFTHVIHQARKAKIRLSTRDVSQNDSATLQYWRADMDLVGADIRKENIVKEYESHERTDYYLGGVCPNGVKDVHNYQRITIKNIYPGIDWVLYTAPGTKAQGKTGEMEYDFVVHPGGDPTAIRLRYKGTTQPELESDGSLKAKTGMGDIVEGLPVSYMYNESLPGSDWKDGGAKSAQDVSIMKGVTSPDTRYTMKDNEISFKIDSSYDRTKTLIIDPTTTGYEVVWGSYYQDGGSGEDITGLSDDGTDVWLTGNTTSTNFATLITGTEYNQSTNGATGDEVGPLVNNGVMLKFTVAGVLDWACYYGGEGGGIENGTIPRSIWSDKTHVWVTGQTDQTNFPTKTLAGATINRTTIGTGVAWNAFIIEFVASTCAQNWATYFGATTSSSSSSDIGYSIMSDGTDVFVTGTTSGTSGFPTKTITGGVNKTALIGTQNAFMLEFTTAGVENWGTYYGGNKVDIGYSIMGDGTDVWVAGSTTSTNFPTKAGGTNQTTLGTGGTQNAFIVELTYAGVENWSTYFGGNGTTDAGQSIYSDGTNVYVTGSTTSTTGFPIKTITGGVNQTTLTAGGDVTPFVAAFTASTTTETWGTYLGGNGGGESDAGYSVMSDIKLGGSSVWVAGGTNGTVPTVNPGCGYFVGTNGGETPFLLQFTSAGVEEWGTFYGSDAEDEGSYVSSDGTNIFVAGDGEASSSYPMVQPGSAYEYTTLNAGETVFIGKFNSESCVVTPITLLYFNCTPVSNGMELKWATGSETNNSFFTIERSGDGTNFSPIATIPGAGNSVFTKTYEYTDMNPLSGMNYYRLSQTDDFGNTVQDNVSACDEEDSVLVYPNPASGVFAIKLPTKDVLTPTNITLYDLLGQKILSQTVQNQAVINISIPTLAASIYLVRIVTAEKTYTVKLVIKK